MFRNVTETVGCGLSEWTNADVVFPAVHLFRCG